jgi:hypothetical protein
VPRPAGVLETPRDTDTGGTELPLSGSVSESVSLSPGSRLSALAVTPYGDKWDAEGINPDASVAAIAAPDAAADPKTMLRLRFSSRLSHFLSSPGGAA